MDGETSFSAIAPSVFDGENYQVWAVMMEAYMDACDRWEAVGEDYEIPPLLGNPTMAQIKNHKDKKTRKSKAKASLYATVSPTIFSRIMTLGSVKAVWDFLKEKYQGDERIRGMKNIFASNIPVVKEVEAIMDPTTFTVLQFAVSTTSIHTICIELGLMTLDAGLVSFISMFTVGFFQCLGEIIVLPLLNGMLGSVFPDCTWFGALMSIIGVKILESGGSPPSVPSHTPTNIQGVDVHEGDWVTSGSIKVWKYTVEGRSEIFKEKIVLDDDKKTVTLIGLEGDLLKIYEVYNVIWQLTPKGQGSLAKLILEYEKLNENVPAPRIYLDFVTRIAKV
ncbi:hypothetical protein GH714_042141 [Hevea brasiliensis]|uniref:Bet v I/Major latex protein domain-containing protein n=1 Tax=Hevea brasiliensis TaxID=3981 RepID=A0A6A6MTA0_HEVBR|nr:hypothetical protein GH714_042141 [Hevea brasiliensis]